MSETTVPVAAPPLPPPPARVVAESATSRGRRARIALRTLQVADRPVLRRRERASQADRDPSAVEGFDRMGWGSAGMYAIGALELAGGIALLIPVLQSVAAMALSGLMVGAFVVQTHRLRRGERGDPAHPDHPARPDRLGPARHERGSAAAGAATRVNGSGGGRAQRVTTGVTAGARPSPAFGASPTTAVASGGTSRVRPGRHRRTYSRPLGALSRRRSSRGPGAAELHRVGVSVRPGAGCRRCLPSAPQAFQFAAVALGRAAGAAVADARRGRRPRGAAAGGSCRRSTGRPRERRPACGSGA